EGAPAELAGLAAGAINTARQIGAVIGIALFGSLIAGRGDFIAGLRVAMAIAGAAFLAGAVIALRPPGALSETVS
ncbi:MAG: MFS transporter, partial [Solirubrobacteraceae bacterium]